MDPVVIGIIAAIAALCLIAIVIVMVVRANRRASDRLNYRAAATEGIAARDLLQKCALVTEYGFLNNQAFLDAILAMKTTIQNAEVSDRLNSSVLEMIPEQLRHLGLPKLCGLLINMHATNMEVPTISNNPRDTSGALTLQYTTNNGENGANVLDEQAHRLKLENQIRSTGLLDPGLVHADFANQVLQAIQLADAPQGNEHGGRDTDGPNVFV